MTTVAQRPPRPNLPGRLLAHPVAIAAIVVLVVNDHVLKGLFPGTWTGKLSDVAGLVFFPLLLAELADIVGRRIGHAAPRPAIAQVAIVTTGLAFAFVKTTAAGGLAFSWGLGAAQWLMTLGFVTGASLRPVAVAVDPGDLVAFPGLALAWAIAARTDRNTQVAIPPIRAARADRRTPAVGIGIVVAAAMSSLATSQAMPESVGEVRTPMALDATRAVAARHLSWDVGDLGDAEAGVTLQVSAQEAGAPTDPEVGLDVAGISVIPDANSFLPFENGYGPIPGRSYDLTDRCRDGCSGGATVIVRLNPDQDLPATFDLVARFVVSGTDSASIDIREDPDRRVDAAPSTVLARVEPTIKVTEAAPDRRTEALLTVDGSVLEDPLTFPLVGRALARVEVTGGAMIRRAYETGLELPDDHVWFSGGEAPAERDWLTNCRPQRDCEIVITLHSRYDPTLDGTVTSPAPGSAGFVELRWTLEIRLEAFDGRPLPADALKLELYDAAS